MTSIMTIIKEFSSLRHKKTPMASGMLAKEQPWHATCATAALFNRLKGEGVELLHTRLARAKQILERISALSYVLGGWTPPFCEAKPNVAVRFCEAYYPIKKTGRPRPTCFFGTGNRT